MDGTPEYMKPLNVGLMFFNDEPQKFFPYSQIEVVDLRNGPEGDDMTERIFKGPIDSMIKSALTFIFIHDGFENEEKKQDTHQDKILEFCKEPPRTTKEIMLYLGLRDRRNFYLKYMRPLLDSERLKMTIPDKPNTKNQKYITNQERNKK